MTANGWWYVLLSAGLVTAANLLIRTGVTRAGGFGANLPELSNSLVRLASQPLFDVGVLLHALAALIWFRVISTEPLSIAYPLLMSITFLLVTLGAVLVFQESITFRQIIGLVIIVLGIILVSGN